MAWARICFQLTSEQGSGTQPESPSAWETTTDAKKLWDWTRVSSSVDAQEQPTTSELLSATGYSRAQTSTTQTRVLELWAQQSVLETK